MTGKLKIVRVLSNPKATKKTRSAKIKRRKGARQRAVRSISGKWVVRCISSNRSAAWWTGTRWTSGRHGARQYGSAASAAGAIKTARKKTPGKNWIVMDVMPA